MNNNINYNLNGNRQNNFQDLQGMKEVRSTRQVISNVHAIVGGSLLGVGALILAMHFLFDHPIAVRVLLITGGSLAFVGIIELIVSTFFRRSYHREQAKLARLKLEGVMFTGEIIRIHQYFGMHIGRSQPIHIECSYENHNGKTCLVRSEPFLHQNEGFPLFPYHRSSFNAPRHDNYTVWVYVNPQNPHDYAVEVFRQLMVVQSDYDYR